MKKTPSKRDQLELPVLTAIPGAFQADEKRADPVQASHALSGWPPLEASAVDRAIFRTMAENYFRSKKK